MNIPCTINVNVSLDFAEEIFSAESVREIAAWGEIRVVNPQSKTIAEHVMNGGTLFITTKNGKLHLFPASKLQKGIRAWLAIPTNAAKILAWDAENERFCLETEIITPEDADEILQYALFGKITYRKGN